MTEEVSWVKWHFAKWLGDPSLRMCSLATRGLWADLLAIMHECKPYGHLLIAERSPSAREIAGLVRASEKEVVSCLSELVTRQVCGVTSDGVIFSRRMVRDKGSRDKWQEYGRRGGNPDLKKAARESPRGVNPDSHESDRESVKTEKETEREKETDTESRRRDVESLDLEFEKVFWPRYPRKDDKGHAIKAFRIARRKVSLETIMAGLSAYEFNRERKLMPLPATWLNGERWGDEQTTMHLPAKPTPGQPMRSTASGLL